MIERKRLTPFLLSLSIVIADQISKALIVHFIPENGIGFSCWNDYLRIIHVRNDAVAFSMGSGFPMALKIVLFIILPLLLIGAMAFFVYRDRELTAAERWCFAGFVGGGLGNLIDRIFRGMSVVDFISTANYGVFGMDRWPTWNIADGAVVCSVVILVIALIFTPREKNGNAKQEG